PWFTPSVSASRRGGVRAGEQDRRDASELRRRVDGGRDARELIHKVDIEEHVYAIRVTHIRGVRAFDLDHALEVARVLDRPAELRAAQPSQDRSLQDARRDRALAGRDRRAVVDQRNRAVVAAIPEAKIAHELDDGVAVLDPLPGAIRCAREWIVLVRGQRLLD